ncbi:MAG: O-methyltransferase [Planctomycetota bacterium]
MSEKASPLNDEHFRYIAEHTAGDDEFMASLKAAAREAGIPSIAINATQASFMQIILKLRGARHVVEVGTLGGYSAIAMARALPADGLVQTIELEPTHADFAESWIAKSDVAGRVKVLRGAGADVLRTLPDASADACFLDADKENYPLYLEECLRILRPGGLVMADNAMGFGRLLTAGDDDRGVAAIRRFNDIMAADQRLHGVIVPLGDGCWVAQKR